MKISALCVGLIALATAPVNSLAAGPGDRASVQTGEAIYAKVADSVFILEISDEKDEIVGSASGFSVQPGLILTNAHVANAGRISITTGGLSVGCAVERVDQLNDLALCRIQARSSSSPLVLADEEPKPGSTIYAIGNPRGFNKTITEGLFTGPREVDGRKLVQVSAAISPGSSGGPIVNAKGEVVGVAVASLTSGQNLNFAVPLAIVRTFLAGQPTSTDAGTLLETAKRLLSQRDANEFSSKTDSAWNKLDTQLAETLEKTVVATQDETVLKTVFETAGFWHSDIALRAARKAIIISKKPGRELYANLARALFQNNSDASPSLSEAEENARRAVAVGLGKNASDLLLLGDIHQAMTNNLLAYSSYRRAEALVKSGDPDALNTYIDLFEATRDLGRNTEADIWFSKAKAEPGITSFQWAEYAGFLSATDRYKDSAISYLEAYKKSNSMAYSYLCNAGTEYYFANLFDEALPLERTCIEVAASKTGAEKTIEVAHRNIAAMLDARGVYDEAVTHAKQAIQLNSSDPWAQYDLAQGLNGLRRFTEAVVAAKAALRLSDGKFGDFHFVLGSAYFSLEQWPEAQQAFQKAAEMNPKDATAAYNVAVSFYNEKYYNDALTWYREVLRRDPTFSSKEQVQRMIDTLTRR